MKYIVHIVIGSIVIATLISFILYKFFNKNIPPSFIGLLLTFITIVTVDCFSKPSNDERSRIDDDSK